MTRASTPNLAAQARELVDGRIEFSGIAEVIESTLDRVGDAPVTHFDDLFAADAEARERSAELIEGLTPA